MNRRSFLTGILAACVAPMILPGAKIDPRRWKVQRGVVQPEPLNLVDFMGQMYALKKQRVARGDYPTEVWIVGDRKQKEEFERKLIQAYVKYYKTQYVELIRAKGILILIDA